MKTIYTLSKNGIPFYVGRSAQPLHKRLNKPHVHRSPGVTIEYLDEGTAQDERYWVQQLLAWGFQLVNKRLLPHQGSHKDGSTLDRNNGKRPFYSHTDGYKASWTEERKIAFGAKVKKAWETGKYKDR